LAQALGVDPVPSSPTGSDGLDGLDGLDGSGSMKSWRLMARVAKPSRPSTFGSGSSKRRWRQATEREWKGEKKNRVRNMIDGDFMGFP